MSLSELLGNVGLFGGAVMCCLALLSIFSVGMIVDKHRRFRSAARQSQQFKAAPSPPLKWNWRVPADRWQKLCDRWRL